MLEPSESARVNPIALVASPLVLGWLLGIAIPFPAAIPEGLRWTGAGLVVLGLLLGGPAFGEFVKAGTTPNPNRMPTSLITHGRYRYTRNPMYLSQFLLYAGVALIVGIVWALLALPLAALAVDRWVVRREEAILERTFGAAYVRYASTVSRWFGRRHPG